MSQASKTAATAKTDTKAAATKAAAVETKAVDSDAAATKPVTDATKAVSGLFNAYVTSGRKAIEGIVEVDKTILGFAKDAFSGYVTLGKDTMQAKCLNDVIDLHAAHAHASIEASAANAREVVELSKTKAKEAYAPVKDIIDTYRPGQAA